MKHETQQPTTPHNVIMENRKKISITGVTHVERFDDQSVILYTTMGQLTIKGSDLHLDQLNTDVGDVAVTGNIYGIVYTDERGKGGFLSRVLR